MLQDVFEEGELTLVGEVDGHALVGIFHLFIDGNEVGTKSGNVDEEGRVCVPYRLPMVPDDLDSYLFSYSFEAGESTQSASEEYCVWPSYVSIQALDINNGEQPFRRFKVNITQGGTVEVVTLVGPEHSWWCQEPGPVIPAHCPIASHAF